MKLWILVKHLKGDITKISTNDIPNHDILVGGFPCQSIFSSRKKARIWRYKGNTIFEIARIISAKKQMLLLENVRNLVSHDKGKTFKTILSTLQSLDYEKLYHNII